MRFSHLDAALAKCRETLRTVSHSVSFFSTKNVFGFVDAVIVSTFHSNGSLTLAVSGISVSENQLTWRDRSPSQHASKQKQGRNVSTLTASRQRCDRQRAKDSLAVLVDLSFQSLPRAPPELRGPLEQLSGSLPRAEANRLKYLHNSLSQSLSLSVFGSSF
jgi:hypothetical protein